MAVEDYRPSLDGVRAVAILMVIAYHDRTLKGGFLGVDVFFVLSGFLITSILLREWGSTGTIQLPRFYVRRFLRLAPALCLFVLAAWAMTHWIKPGLADQLRGRWAALALLYVSNLAIAYGREYPLGEVSICWSLALEEQFYLLWPLSLRTLLRRRLAPRTVAVLLAVLVGGALALRYLLLARHPGDPGLWLRVYFGPDTRGDGLLMGCLLALVFHRPPTGRLASVTVLGGLAGAGVLAYLASSREIADFVAHPVLFSVSAASAVLVLLGALTPGVLKRALELPLLVWIGQLSYSLYLWHALSIDLLVREGPLRQHALMFGLAVASHYLLERPVLDINRRFGALQRPHPRLFARWGARPVEPRPNGRGPLLRLAAGLVGLGVAVGLASARFGGPPLPRLELSPLVQARERVDDGEYARAVTLYREAAPLDPGDGSVLAEMADALTRAGDATGAVAAWRRALERRPQSAERRVALGGALIATGSREEARAAFHSALALDPGLADAHLGLGTVALDQDQLTEALGELSLAVALRPDNARAQNELGVALALAGNFEEAIRHFSLSFALRPDPSVRANLARARSDREGRPAPPSP
ncbi:MAG TPA: acyltransferase family protein [Vicinamibacteria bacterium]|nr:acyltransferase family protein [Vicinamibacteria bacterium]